MTLESILLLLNSYAVGKLAILESFAPFVRSGPNVLILFLIPTISTLFYLLYVRPDNEQRLRRGFWWVVATTYLLIIVLAARQLAFRSVETQPLTDNDGAIQSREAARFLLQGVNPYEADYRTTPFWFFTSPVGPGVDNVAATHYAYPPLQFLMMVPTVFINDHFDTTFDTQLILLFVFMLFSTVVVMVGPTWALRTRLFILTSGNAWLIYLTLAGFNDVVFVMFLTAAAALTMKKQALLGALMLGLAFASKQTAWLTIPLWVSYWWATRTIGDRVWWRPAAMAAGVALVVILPFFLWSPAAYFDDTIRYVSGSIPFTYPLSGTTLMQYIRVSGLITDPWQTFSTWPLQLTVWALLTWQGWRSIRRDPRTSIVLTWSVITILGVLLVSRFAPDNYYLALVELAIAAYAMHLAERSKKKFVDHAT